MQPYVTTVALSILGLVVALAWFGCLSARLARQAVPPGWHALRPGLGHWFAALASAAFSTLVAWVYIFVGSARRDAAFQMRVAFFLSVAFGLCAIYAAWHIRAIKHDNIRWRGMRIVRSQRDGPDQTHDGGSAVSWWRTWSGLFALRFVDGATLYVDPFTTGSDEFAGTFGPPEDTDDADDPRP